MRLPHVSHRPRKHVVTAGSWAGVVGVVLAALIAFPVSAQQPCPTEGQFMMAIARQGLDPDRVYMVKGARSVRVVEETVAVAGDFVPPYDYVLVVERDGYTSVNPVHQGWMCMHWRLAPRDWRAIKAAVFGTVS